MTNSLLERARDRRRDLLAVVRSDGQKVEIFEKHRQQRAMVQVKFVSSRSAEMLLRRA